MIGFLLRAAIVAIALWLATHLFSGLHFDHPNTLIAAALLLGIVNAIVRPIAIILTLPLTLLTLGFFLLVVNAAMIGLVALILDGLTIRSFWTALGTSIVVSVISWAASGFLNNRGRVEVLRWRNRGP
jgi:putative membrane protein